MAIVTEAAQEVPQGFKPTAIGLLPGNWDVVRLDELFRVQQGKALSPRARMGVSPQPFLRTANILWGRVDFSTLDQMDFSDEEVAKLSLEPGDLLVCEGGETGRTAMWAGELGVCCYQNHIHRLRRRAGNICPEFYMYWMQAALLMLGLYIGQATKTTIPNLSGARLKSFLLPKPAHDEQRVIAHVLSTIQRAIEATDRVIAAARQLKRSLMRHLFTYGPVPIAQAETVPLKETEIGPVPEQWEVVRLAEVAPEKGAIITGPFGSQLKKKDLVRSGIKVFEQENIISGNSMAGDDFIDEAKFRSLQRFSVQAGDVLMTRLGTLGHALEITANDPRGITGSRLLRIRPHRSRLRPSYLVDLIRSPGMVSQIEQRGHGVVMKGLNTEIAKSLHVALPPVDEQDAIVAHLRAMSRKEQAETARRAVLQQLFRTMLQLLMTGQVRIRDLEGESHGPSQ